MNKLTLKDFKLAAKKGMNVLYYDIETTPMKVYTFYIGPQVSIQHSQIINESKIICIQYMWEGDLKPKYLMWEYKNGAGNDKYMLEKFSSSILSKADILIGQNIDAFDSKILRGRLAKFNLNSFPSTSTIDILKLSRQSFRLPSHKLDYRSIEYGFGGKNKMDLKDWIDIVEGKVSPLKKMIPYGLKDVKDTQDIFYKEFNYYKKFPSKIEKIISSYLIEEKIACPKCKMARQARFNVNRIFLSQGAFRYNCNNCNYIWRPGKINIGY